MATHVKCVDNKGAEESLTVGKTYKVKRNGTRFYHVYNDDCLDWPSTN